MNKNSHEKSFSEKKKKKKAPRIFGRTEIFQGYRITVNSNGLVKEIFLTW